MDLSFPRGEHPAPGGARCDRAGLGARHRQGAVLAGCRAAAFAEAIAASERAAEPVGHAIEVRIAAEDPSREFAPTPGLVRRWEMPSGPGVRVDAAVGEGDRIPPEYDNLIAKIMVHAGDRAAAIRRLQRALAETEVAGLSTTLPFHRFVADHRTFQAGELSTGWVGDWWDGPGERRRGTRAALLAAGLDALTGGLATWAAAAAAPPAGPCRRSGLRPPSSGRACRRHDCPGAGQRVVGQVRSRGGGRSLAGHGSMATAADRWRS